MKLIYYFLGFFSLFSCENRSIYEIETTYKCDGIHTKTTQIKAPNNRKALIMALNTNLSYISTMKGDCADFRIYKNKEELKNLSLFHETIDSLITSIELNNENRIPENVKKKYIEKYAFYGE